MKTIGIVGGVGPYAGLDLVKKIFDNTEAQRDQEHLDVLLINSPRLIDDRTNYILAVRDGKVATDPALDPANPGCGIVACIRKLAAAGAEVVGVPLLQPGLTRASLHDYRLGQILEALFAAHLNRVFGA